MVDPPGACRGAIRRSRKGRSPPRGETDPTHINQRTDASKEATPVSTPPASRRTRHPERACPKSTPPVITRPGGRAKCGCGPRASSGISARRGGCRCTGKGTGPPVNAPRIRRPLPRDRATDTKPTAQRRSSESYRLTPLIRRQPAMTAPGVHPPSATVAGTHRLRRRRSSEAGLVIEKGPRRADGGCSWLASPAPRSIRRAPCSPIRSMPCRSLYRTG